MSVPRAAYVALDDARNCFDFVYDEKPEKLKEVGGALQTIMGIGYTDPIARKGGGSSILVAIRKGADVKAVVAVLKKVLNPKLPIGVRILALSVEQCRKKIHRSATCVPTFIPGFEPESELAFNNQLYVGVKKLKREDFFPTGGEPHADLYVLAMAALFKRLGAFVQEATLSVESCC